MRCSALLAGVSPLVCVAVGPRAGRVFHAASVPQAHDHGGPPVTSPHPPSKG